jgi:type VI secretion system protein ImpB
MSSMQKDTGRIRPPRVHIIYEVHVGNAIEKKELPFVVGVLADLSGESRRGLPKLKKRTFVEINRINFNQILSGIGPSLKLNAPNLIQGNDTELVFNLKFESMDDFKPVRVAEQIAGQVESFANLLDLRRQIKKLLTTMDGKDTLQDLVQKMINDRDALKQLCHEAGRDDLEPQEARP